MFVTADLQTMSDMIVRYLDDLLQYKFQMPGSNGLLFIEFKPKAKEDVCMVTMLFFEHIT